MPHGGPVKVKVALKPATPAVAPFDAQQAKKYQEQWARQLGVPVEITNSIGMKFILIPPGELEMGSPKELIDYELENCSKDNWVYRGLLPSEGPRHHVRITKAFYLGICPVTQEEYQRLMGSNPSSFLATGNNKNWVAGLDTKRFPVDSVSWNNAVEFCSRLSETAGEKTSGRRSACRRKRSGSMHAGRERRGETSLFQRLSFRHRP